MNDWANITRILVTGADGMLGEAIEHVFKKDYNLILTDKEEFDVRFPKEKLKTSPDAKKGCPEMNSADATIRTKEINKPNR